MNLKLTIIRPDLLSMRPGVNTQQAYRVLAQSTNEKGEKTFVVEIPDDNPIAVYESEVCEAEEEIVTTEETNQP